MHRMSQAVWSALVIGVGGAGILLGSAPAFAACTRTITITQQQAMRFGTIAPASGGGHVTLSPTGNETAPSGFVVVAAGGAASFNVFGSSNCGVIISFTPGALTGPGASMTVTNFSTNAGPSPMLNLFGLLNFSVGADLVVNPAQVSGTYSGTYNVTVVY
jgi:hypothetical protein